MIPEKYRDLGFEISKFGANSLALRRNDKAIFVFSSSSEIKDEFVSAICDYHLKRSEEPALQIEAA